MIILFDLLSNVSEFNTKRFRYILEMHSYSNKEHVLIIDCGSRNVKKKNQFCQKKLFCRHTILKQVRLDISMLNNLIKGQSKLLYEEIALVPAYNIASSSLSIYFVAYFLSDIADILGRSRSY